MDRQIGPWRLGGVVVLLLCGILEAQQPADEPVAGTDPAESAVAEPVGEAAPPDDGQAAAPQEPAGTGEAAPPPAAAGREGELLMFARFLIFEGGVIGWIIIGLSVWLVALMLQQMLSVRRNRLMPPGLAEELHGQITGGNFRQAEELCRQKPSYLAYVVASGLAEVPLGYTAVEKSMEDSSQQQAARLYRALEYFTVIGTVAPMLGLLGTVWGMIEAFMEFETKVNPQVSELAPGIYKALVTTFQGLVVAIPALAMYVMFRNRADELVAQTTLMAEHIFSAHRRSEVLKRLELRRPKGTG